MNTPRRFAMLTLLSVATSCSRAPDAPPSATPVQPQASASSEEAAPQQPPPPAQPERDRALLARAPSSAAPLEKADSKPSSALRMRAGAAGGGGRSGGNVDENEFLGALASSPAPSPSRPEGAVRPADKVRKKEVADSVVAVRDPAPQLVFSAFVDASKDPFSTFGADVDTASYDYFRKSMQTRQALPDASHVRVEDFVNFFRYDYPAPAADAAQPFAISLAASAHPLGRKTTLLRVGIQAKNAPKEQLKQANLVFLVDVSGSMAASDKLPLVQRTIKAALPVLAPNTKISIVTYAGETRVALPPTELSERSKILEVVERLESGGSTNGASGIDLAYAQAEKGFVKGGINHVVLCTDGDFNIGITSSDDLVGLIRKKRATGITLTALGFGMDNLNDAMMERVSNAGNGMYSLVSNDDQAVEYANERLLSTVVHVAKDMKIQVEFNMTKVSAYRLLGYENRAIADHAFRDDKVDGGEVGAGHRVTALYELVLKGEALPDVPGAPKLSMGEGGGGKREITASELVVVKVRSKKVTASDADPASETRAALTLEDVKPSADRDSAWAAAVAGFAEHLRHSPYAQEGELDAIRRIVKEQSGRDSDRAELEQLLGTLRTGLVARSP